MATLTKPELIAAMKRESFEERLIVTPLLGRNEEGEHLQVGPCGIDLRLNNQFIVFRGRSFRAFDAGEPEQLQRFFSRHGQRLTANQSLANFKETHTNDPRALVWRYQEKVVVRFRSEFVLHPHETVLGSSFEYLSMPMDLEGQVEGRSSWARLGLAVVSASTVEPGFHGVVTLELSNLGTQPLVLWPGVRIASLVLHRTTSPVAYDDKKKYVCPVGPEFSRLYLDSADMEKWVGKSRMEELADLLADELLESEKRTAELLKDSEDPQPSQGPAGSVSG